MADESKSGLQNIITRTTATIGVKTSVFIGSAKVKTHINTIKKEISTLTDELGNIVYELWEKGEEDKERIDRHCQQIKEKYAGLEDLNAEIARLEQQESEVLGNKKQEENKQPSSDASEIKYVCPSCNTVYEAPSKFCRKCGTKMI